MSSTAVQESADEFRRVVRRIETLTNVLYHLKHKSPSIKGKKDDIPSFLRHFTNLLTYGGKVDSEAKKIVAVTGTFEGGNKVKALVVTQNPSSSSNAPSLSVKRVPIGSDSFDDVVKRPDPENLQQHIQDICTALLTYSPDDPDQLEALEIFIVSRCYRKLRMQFDLYEKLFGVGLDEQIRGWDSGNRELNAAPEWIDTSNYLIPSYLPAGTEIKTRTVKRGGVEKFQCEFSEGIWSQVLAKMIAALREAFQKVDDAKFGIKSTTSRPTDEERKAYQVLNDILFDLFFYVQSSPGLAEKLLSGTTLGSVLAKKVGKKVRDEVEGSEDMGFESDEDTGQYVLRYLRTIVAWHYAIHTLIHELRRLNINDVDIRLVEISFQTPSLLTLDEIKEEYAFRHPNSKDHIALLDDENCPSSFSGTVHAEAMLMGLLAYFGSDKGHVIYELDAKDLTQLQEIIKPATGNDKYIAVGKKCCWCCNRLAYYLGRHIQSEFKLPGTHGILYAWSPPRVGVDVSVLKALEGDLWEALASALNTRARPSLSRQSNDASIVPSEPNWDLLRGCRRKRRFTDTSA